ncbi:MAG: hypothetical protein J5I50_08310 [Chitinophagaceae bacterium]|nr:hypothetical protein [Chitinophagaceae bacterium]
MFKIFLDHQWKEFWRGRNKAGSLAAKIFMMIIYIYFLLIALGVGFFMKGFLKEIFPAAQPVAIFNGLVLYYFLVDFLLRVQLQELPTMSVQPYLTLNIRKKTIINFLNGKTLLNFFNLMPLIIFLPFCFTEIASVHGTPAMLGYIVSILSLTVFNNFLLVYVKRKATGNIMLIAIGVLVVLILGALDYFGVISISDFSNLAFRSITKQPALALIFTAAAAVIYSINYKYLYNNLYTEEMVKKEAEKTATDYPFLNRFGEVGQLAALELKLILRHKRSKSAIMMSFAFVLYGFFFYRAELLNNNQFSLMLFAAIFMTGIFQIAYGQYMFAWQSAHFDGLMANKINFKNFIKAKFLLFTIAATLVTMLTFLYGFMSWKLIVLHFVVFLYNIGFGAVIVLFFANYNKKRLDLSKGGAFNWQGVGATQWIMSIPLIVIPFLIYMPFGMANEPFWGLTAIGLFGLVTLSLREMWVNLLTKLFAKQRYKIAEGFRE